MTTAAVVGCGDVSTIHLQAIERLEGIDLVAVCDPDEDRAAATAGRHDVPAFASHQQMLSAVRPDVVHVCTPHDQHVPVAVDCLEAGVGVLIEKPLAHTVAEGRRLVAAARQHPGVTAGVCLQNRYNPDVQAARALLRSGELGAVRGGSATLLWHREPAYYRARPWRGRARESGGGVLINQAIHTLDLLQWLLGDVVLVHGRTGRHRPEGIGGVDVEDTAQVILEHAGGARSVLFATILNVVDSPVAIEIVTEGATLLIRDGLTVTYPDGRSVVTVDAPAPAASAGRPYWGASHEPLIADFHRTVTRAQPFWIDPHEAARSLDLVHRIYSLDR